MVMVLVGILAVFAAPRMLDLQGLNARGFHNETLALLRYAQKSAIAQRRTVCVTWAANNATLTLDADQDAATGAGGCEMGLTGPRGETPASVQAANGVAYGSTPLAFSFDALGQPSVGQTVQVGGVGNAITVENATGYVHE
jgi:MSHA pilin protein MshC